MRRISSKKRVKVLKQYFLGYSNEDNAKISKVSKGSVFNIVNELKKGKYPEFESVRDLLDELRSLASDIKKHGLGVPQAVLGLTFYEMIKNLVEPQVLPEFIKLCERLSPPNFPINEFIDTAIRLNELEKRLGKTCDDALRNLEKEVEEKSSKKTKLTAELEAMKDLKAHLDDELKNAKAQLASIKRKLDEAIKGNECLEKIGVKKVCKLSVFVKECEELHYSARNLQRIMKLGIVKPVLEKEVSALRKRIKALKEETEWGEVSKQAIITGNDVFLAMRDILENQAISVACQYCDKPMIVPIPCLSTLKVHLKLDWIYSPKCGNCGSLNVVSPLDILKRIGFTVLASQVYDRI